LQQTPDDPEESGPEYIDGCTYTDASHTHNIYYTVQRSNKAETPLAFIQCRKDDTSGNAVGHIHLRTLGTGAELISCR